MRRKLSVFVGLGTLGILLVGALIAETPARDLRDVQEFRQQGDLIRLTAPHQLPELVPVRAPGPGVTA